MPLLCKNDRGSLRSFLLVGGVSALLLTLSGCSDRETRTDKPAASAAPATSVVMTLGNTYRPSQILVDQGIIDFGKPEDRLFLREGWSRDEHEDSRDFVWAVGNRSSIVLPLRSRVRFQLALTVRPFSGENGTTQTFRVLCNDVPVAFLTIKKGWNTYTILLPQEVITPGNNVISFLFSQSGSPQERGLSSDNRALSVCFDRCGFSRPDSPGLDMSSEGESLPRFSLGRLYAGNDEQSWTLWNGTSLSFSLRLPEKALIELTFGDFISGVSPKGSLTITIEDSRGERHDVTQFTPVSSSSKNIDLSPWQNQDVFLQVAYTASEETAVLPLMPLILHGQRSALTIEDLKRKTTKKRPPIVVIGFDGASWDLLHPMLERNQLPSLAQLIARGFASPLRTLLPSKSPALWTSIGTGKRPDKHGIDDFMRFDPVEKRNVSLTADYRTSKFVWDILNDVDKRVMIVGWWPTWPAEPINGFIVSHQFGEPHRQAETWPDDLAIELEKNFTLPEFPLSLFFPKGTDLERNNIGSYKLQAWEKQAIDGQLKRVFRRDSYFYEASQLLLAREIPDLFAVYLNGSDPVSHAFWGYLHPEISGLKNDQCAALGGIVPGYYRYLDSLVGKILANFPADSTIIVVSDHGFGTNAIRDFSIDTNALLAHAGFLSYQADGETPDRERTFAERGKGYSTNFSHYLEFPEHEILTREQFNNKLGEMKSTLEAITCLPSGNQLVTVKESIDGDSNSVILSYNLGNCLDQDLLIGGKHVQFEQIFTEKHITGVHSHGPDGILIMAGPGIVSADLTRQKRRDDFNELVPSPSILDITPTILTLSGLPLAADMDGRVLKEAFEAQAASSKPESDVFSYDDLGVHRPQAMHVKTETSTDDEVQLLKSLGYID